MSRAAALRIVDPGWGTTVQDLGRPGYSDLGVPRAGAVDRSAHALANRLIGNDDHAATFETRGRLIVEALTPVTVATSADGVRSTVGVGERVTVDHHPDDGWAYLAVRGGIDVDPVLGSRSHDTLSGLGPPPVSIGADYAVGPDPRTEMSTDLAPRRRRPGLLRIWPAPWTDALDGGLDVLGRTDWIVGDDVSRVGCRMTPAVRGDGTPNIWAASSRSTSRSSMPSEGLIEGAVQMTPSGEAIVMLANHPTTGGYPVVAVVDPDDVPVAANARPGARLRLRSA